MGITASSTTPEVSVEVTPASGTSGAIRRHPKYKDSLRANFFPDVTTCYEAFQRGLKMSADRPCFGFRPVVGSETVDGKTAPVVGDFSWFTFRQAQDMIERVGSGMTQLNLAPVNDLGHRLVGIYSKNRYEWAVAQQVCNAYKLICVPLYDTLGAEAVSFIIQQTGMGTVFCSKIETPKLLAAKKASAVEMASLVHVIQFEDVAEEQRAAATEAGISLRSFAEVQQTGAANRHPVQPPKPEDIAVICYTSGTTGNPKGAILTHKVQIADSSSAFFCDLGIEQEDVHLSYLPLAHVFEQLVENALLCQGAAIGFFQGDVAKLMDDIKVLRPTIFPSVPRLFNRIYDRVYNGAQAAGGLKTTLFNKGLESKKEYLRQNYLKHSFWDGLVFGKVAARVGLDRCKLLVTGSAPLAAHVMEFMRVVLACHMVEGYGQTECGGAATVTSVHDQASLGHVGGPVAANEVKLVSVEDMGYLVTDTVHGQEVDAAGKIITAGLPCVGRGEVCYRGENIFPGYYKDAEKTAEALDSEGWLHSGDIGLWDGQGHLRIVDRKKNIFKLSQGEYVAAEKIENVIISSSLIAQAFVYGDSFHNVLVAVIVPDEDGVKSWADDASRGKRPGKNVAALVADSEGGGAAALQAAINADLVRVCKEKKLQGFEIPRALFLEAKPWTPEDLLTPTFKLKRQDAKKRYQVQLDAMYATDSIAGRSDVKQGAVGGAAGVGK